MSNDEQSYNRSEIRKLLNLFDDVELDTLCFDHFIEVYEKFSRGMRKDEKINLLFIYCRRAPNRFEKLMAIVQSEDKEAFKQFEPSIRSQAHDPLFVFGVERGTKLRRLFSELSEWKVIHHDVQGLLNELEDLFKFLNVYHFKKELDSLSEALFAWQELQVSKLGQIPSKWLNQYAESPSLINLPEMTILIDDTVERLMNESREADFKTIYAQFRKFRALLWSILETADEKIKILIEEILRQIGA